MRRYAYRPTLAFPWDRRVAVGTKN